MKTLLKQTLALFIIISGIALADADGPDYYKITGVASDDVLNMRSEANYNAQKVGEIPAKGNCVKNLGCQGGLTMSEFRDLLKAEQTAILRKRPRWCQVEYRGIKGWVSARFLSEGSCNKP